MTTRKDAVVNTCPLCHRRNRTREWATDGTGSREMMRVEEKVVHVDCYEQLSAFVDAHHAREAQAREQAS